MKLKNIIVFLIILLLGVVIGGLISENRANKVLLQNYEQESNIEKM
jgi:NADH:ubiquinone oxidoreductase subunit 3 (subunit A)